MTSPPVVSEPALPSVAPDGTRLERWILPALGVASLVLSCVLLSHHKQEWADEVFTRIEVSDPSLLHLMTALTRLGGAGMPLFYLTMWPWAHVFGFSDLALRLYSCAGICGAFLVLVAALRRLVSPRAAFIGSAFGLFACLIVVDQNAEARGYGLYLLLCSLAIARILRIAEISRPGRRELALVALTQAGVVLGHVLGLIFSGLMLVALLAADRLQQRFRWRIYCAYLTGWLALLPWIPAIRASVAVAKPHGWIEVPTLSDLTISISYWLFAGIYFPLFKGTHFGIVVGWLVSVFCVVAVVIASVHGLRSAAPAKQAASCLGIALLLGAPAFYLISHLVTPIWVGRYLIPTALGIGILTALWADSAAIRRIAGVVLCSLLLLLPVTTALLEHPDALDVARVEQIADGRTVVCDWAQDFVVMLRYSSDPGALQFPLDWSAALSGPPSAVGAYHLMFNYRRDGYMTGHLLDVNQVLQQASFLVLDSNKTNWFKVEIEANPRFQWNTVAQIDGTRRLIAVQRRR